MTRRLTALGALLGALALGVSAGSGAFIGGLGATQTVATATLAAPSALTTRHASPSEVELTWTAAGGVAADQQVLRASNAGGPWATIATVGPSTGAFSDSAAPANADSYYRVRATRNNWTADSSVWSSHALPMTAGTERVSGTGAGTALSGPWTLATSQLGALAAADGTRYRPPAWPNTPASTTWATQSSRYLELVPRVPALAPDVTVAHAAATLTYRTTSAPNSATRLVLVGSADAGTTWQTFDLPLPAGANSDVTTTVDLAALGFDPPTRAEQLRLRFVAAPRGGPLTVEFDLVHVDIN